MPSLMRINIRCSHQKCSVKKGFLRNFTKFTGNVSCKTRNHPQTSQTTHKSTKPATNQPNHPKTTQKPAKPLINQPSRKPVFNVTKNFSNNANHVLNLQLFYSVSSTFSSEDQSQVRIEGK